MVSMDEMLPSISSQAMKTVFAHIPTSVAVITIGDRSENYGATVGTLTALSLDPPMLMFAMKAGSRLLQWLNTDTAIGINVLTDHQKDIAATFATPGIDRFGAASWCEEHSLPRIDATLVWIVAKVKDRLPLGDHELITARVQHADTADHNPLLYWKREFTMLKTGGH